MPQTKILKADGKDKEQSGSSAYVPKEPEKDKQLQYALAFVRGTATEATATDLQKAPPPEQKGVAN